MQYEAGGWNMELKTAIDLQDHLDYRAAIGDNHSLCLIERIDRAETALAEAKATVERLSAPVSDEEFKIHFYELHGPEAWGLEGCFAMSRDDADKLIAARKDAPCK